MKMKKLLSAMLLLVMSLSLSACSGLNEAAVPVDEYFKAAKTLDTVAMEKQILPTNTEGIEKNKELLQAEDDPFSKLFVDFMKDKAKKMTYSIKETKVDGDKATITVDTKYVDAGPLLKAVFGDLIMKMMGSALSGGEPSEEEAKTMFTTVMNEQTAKFEETFKTKTIQIPVVKKDGKWYIEQVAEDMIDVASSGFVSVVSEMGNAFGE